MEPTVDLNNEEVLWVAILVTKVETIEDVTVCVPPRVNTFADSVFCLTSSSPKTGQPISCNLRLSHTERKRVAPLHPTTHSL